MAMSFLLSLLLPTVAFSSFEDVSPTHPQVTAIEYAQSQDIVEGYEDGTFQPDRTISRVEFLKILIEAEIPQSPGCQKTYEYGDVDWNAWSGTYIHIASCLGIASGYSDGLFRPHNAVTYAEAAKIISGVYVFEVIPEEPWYASYISKIKEKGATPRSNIMPTDTLTRGEMAQIIYLLEFPTDFEPLEKSIINKMEEQHIPALSILVFQNDQKLYEQYFGKSHIQSNIDVEDNHLFLLASVSKVITATALLQLYDQGLFSLDDAVNDYLPFEVSVPNHTTDLTFRMLLTHTSGIADGSALDDQYYYGKDSPVDLGYFLEHYLVPGGEFYDASENFHDFNPGTEHEYSNIGSALIGLLVENISEQDFDEYCQQHIFDPLEMNNTFWSLDKVLATDRTIVQPYNYEDGQYQTIEHYTFTDYPNGGLRSTSEDLFRFLQIFLQTNTSNTLQILKPATVAEMLQLQISHIDSTMGLHIFTFDQSNNLWGHDGGEDGTTTILAFNPVTQVGIIILTNMSDVDLDDIFDEAYDIL
jgi:CubicO group peptidase (beta-lactamase class C family)